MPVRIEVRPGVKYNLLPRDRVVLCCSTHASPAVVRFGVFEADFRAGELYRSGVKVRVQDLPFRALTVLLSRPNEIVTREELRQELWPDDVFVDFDRGISSAIKRLRDALGDAADNPVFIETIERHGYRWIGPASIVDPPPPPASYRMHLRLPLPSKAKAYCGF